ncbi:hypothetical protein A6E15_12985 [Natrinema saccharevitans]|uniref:DUF7344 domain-containing protein n=1 Tax=Natrinema saccharevitans TaxID=301967 RepID=A0A1S8B1N5_9EURY|nr:hypothetical protein [Natrinema saccharevitans]OLZ42721.1 hypothetical protein A6E15_12985 [Natrinema saccharevitans]
MSVESIGETAIEETDERIDDASDGLTQDVAFTVLSCPRRRYSLHYLMREQREVSLRELSRELAAWENDVDVDAVTHKQRMRVYTALRQSHLPKMDENDIVEFDSSAGVIELTDDASELEVYLDVVPHDEIPWSTYYLGLGGLCAVAVTLSGVGLFPLSEVPGLGLAALVTLLFVGSAIAHRYHERANRLGSAGDPPA